MKLSTVTEQNKGISLAGERVVVLGGTQGIGAGVAWRFAEAGAEVWIVGRNETKANAVLENLKASSAEHKIDPPPEHLFLKADLSLVREAKRVVEEFRARAGERGIDYLVMSQGGPPNGTFVRTSEGYEQHYGVQVLSRFIIAHGLAGDPESSIVKKGVISIMAPGKAFGTFYADDLDMRRAEVNGHYGVFAAISRDSIMADAFIGDLAKGNPKVTFNHVYPGAVKTDFARNTNVPWWFSIGFAVALALGGTSPQQYAEIPFYLLANPDGRKLAARDMFLNEKLARVETHGSFKDEGIRAKIRRHLWEVTNATT